MSRNPCNSTAGLVYSVSISLSIIATNDQHILFQKKLSVVHRRDPGQGPDLAGHGYLLRRDILIRPCKERMSFETAIAIIPARLESTRLPGKILIEIAGKSLIQHVYERVKQAATLRRIIVATDSAKVAETVENFGGT